MSQLYNDYLREHMANVGKAWVWMRDNCLVSPVWGMEAENLVRMHDVSKTKMDEYRAYDDYFYGGGFVGLCSALTVPFMILKLDGVIEWPWLLVLAPFWIPMAVLALILLLAIKTL